MYTENGITYVEGIEDEWMGYFLRFHKNRYKHVPAREIPDPDAAMRIQAVDERRRQQAMERWEREHEAKQIPEEDLQPKREVVITEAAIDAAKQAQKEYHRAWYQRHREELRKKYDDSTKGRERKRTQLNIPAMAGTPEYSKIYYQLRKEENRKRAKQYYQRKKEAEANGVPYKRKPRKLIADNIGHMSDYSSRSEYMKAYYQAHKEELTYNQRLRYRTNPEYRATKLLKRRKRSAAD